MTSDSTQDTSTDIFTSPQDSERDTSHCVEEEIPSPVIEKSLDISADSAF